MSDTRQPEATDRELTVDEAKAALTAGAFNELVNIHHRATKQRTDMETDLIYETLRERLDDEPGPLLSATEAVQALLPRLIHLREYGREPRTIVHCVLGGIGADWDLHTALTLVDGSAKRVVTDGMFGRTLVVITDDDVYVFDGLGLT